MKKDSNIWRRPKYVPYVQPEVTPAIIEEAEKKIGLPLPTEYLDLLRIQNGGHIRYSIKQTPHNQTFDIGPHYPSITNFEWLREYDDLSFEVNNLFPFDGDGHWNTCLDYRKNETSPQVTYIDTESDFEVVIGKTFHRYLDKMIPKHEYGFVIASELNEVSLIERIEACLQIKFKVPDLRFLNYPLYSASYKDSWIVVAPNKVPSGLVRENDERYLELKNQMDEISRQYAEIHESYHFMNIHDSLSTMKIKDKFASEDIQLIVIQDSLIISEWIVTTLIYTVSIS